MFTFALVIAVTAFLGGAATAAFLMLCIGVRKAGRPPGRPGHPGGPADSLARSALRTGTWPHTPVAFGDTEDD